MLYVAYLPHKLKLDDDTADEAYNVLMEEGLLNALEHPTMFEMLKTVLSEYFVRTIHSVTEDIIVLVSWKKVEKIRKSKKFMEGK